MSHDEDFCIVVALYYTHLHCSEDMEDHGSLISDPRRFFNFSIPINTFTALKIG